MQNTNESRVREAVRDAVASNSERLDLIKGNMDNAVEQLYFHCAHGDVGRGDVRRWIEDEVQQIEASTIEGGGFFGRRAVNVFRLITLKSSLRMYVRHGMFMARGVTLTSMLAMASEATGKRYARSKGGAAEALADMGAAIAEARKGAIVN